MHHLSLDTSTDTARMQNYQIQNYSTYFPSSSRRKNSPLGRFANKSKHRLLSMNAIFCQSIFSLRYSSYKRLSKLIYNPVPLKGKTTPNKADECPFRQFLAMHALVIRFQTCVYHFLFKCSISGELSHF